jgi:hypothetical protein
MTRYDRSLFLLCYKLYNMQPGHLQVDELIEIIDSGWHIPNQS